MIREQLYAYAKKLFLEEPVEKQKLADLAKEEESLRLAAIRLVQAACTPEDVAVLKKFGSIEVKIPPNDERSISHNGWLCLHQQESWTRYPNRKTCYQIKLKYGDPVLSVPNTNVPLRAGHPFWTDMGELKKKRNVLIQHRDDRLRAYYNVIYDKNTTTMKKLIELWPEAADADIVAKVQLPSRITKSDTTTILQDVARRQAARENHARPVC